MKKLKNIETPSLSFYVMMWSSLSFIDFQSITVSRIFMPIKYGIFSTMMAVYYKRQIVNDSLP